MLKKIITALGLTIFTTISYADYFYSYTNQTPLVKNRVDPYDYFENIQYGSLTFATNLELAPSSTYNIGTRYSGTFETIFTRYVGLNLRSTLDGSQTKSPVPYSDGYVITNELSQIIEWNIYVDFHEPTGYNTSSANGDTAIYFSSVDYMTWHNAGGGTWSLTVQAIPEPSGSALFLSGILTLGILRRYKTESQ